MTAMPPKLILMTRMPPRLILMTAIPPKISIPLFRLVVPLF